MRLIGFLVIVHLALGSASVSVALGQTPAPIASAARRGMDLIHEGKLSIGQDVLDANARSHPQSRTALFYAGVGCWWRHIAEFGNERSAERAIDYFRRAIAAGPIPEQDPEALFEAGTASMLLAHLEGAAGSVLRAGRDAKRGKQMLEMAGKVDPGNKDVEFGLGAYDYYADKLPRIMKGIRALLMLPGGNASRGIAELQAASRGGKVFGCEASLVLADIFASSMEDKYDLGLEILSGLIERYPQNPFYLTGRADVLSSVGEHDLALRDIERAVPLVGEEDATLRAGVIFEKARILDAGFASEEAAKLLEPLLTTVHDHVPATQLVRMRFTLGEMKERLGDERALAIYRELSREDLDARMRRKVERKLDKAPEPASPGYREAQAAIVLLRSGRVAEAETALRALLVARPAEPVLLFLLAECHYAGGKRREIRASYDEAYFRAGSSVPWVSGWCLLRLGDIARSEGRRDEALRRYAQASAISRWRRQAIISYRLAQVASLGTGLGSASSAGPPASSAGR